MKKYEKKTEGNRISFWDAGQEVFWMKEQLIHDNTAVEVCLGGALRADSVHEFKTEMGKFLALSFSMELDLSEVTGISVVYMHEFVHLQQAIEKKSNVSLKLKNLSDPAAAAIHSHGIDALLHIQ